jgi:hypothetical protein
VWQESLLQDGRAIMADVPEPPGSHPKEIDRCAELLLPLPSVMWRRC